MAASISSTTCVMRNHAVGVQRDRFDAVFHQPAGDLGKIGGGLAADADVFAAALAGLDGISISMSTAGLRSSTPLTIPESRSTPR